MQSITQAAHQIAMQVWPKFKRLPQTTYRILVVNDHYDHQFNFFLEIYRPHYRTHSYPLYTMANQDLRQLENLLSKLRTQENLQLTVDFRGFNDQRWPQSHRRVISHPYQPPQKGLTKNQTNSSVVNPRAPIKLPRYSTDEAEKVATAFFANEYVDYGMGKWHGFRVTNLSAESDELTSLPSEAPKNQQSSTSIVALLHLAKEQQQSVHLQLMINHHCHYCAGRVLGIANNTLFLQRLTHQKLAVPLNLIHHGELIAPVMLNNADFK